MAYRLNPLIDRVAAAPVAEAQSWVRGRRFPPDKPLLDCAQAVPSYPPAEALTSAGISASFERLRHLAPLAKPALLRACMEAAMADGSLRLPEAELLRAVAATLDCPIPPVLAAQDPLTLAA